MSRVLRSPEGKVKRKKYRRAMAALFVALAVALVWGISWLSSRPALLISHIQTEGNQKISSEEIAQETLALLSGKYFFLFPKANMLWYPKGELRTHFLEKYPRVKDISFSRPAFFSPDFHTISARVVEREERAIWCADVSEMPQCFLLDEAGFVFAAFGAGERETGRGDENFLAYAFLPEEEERVREKGEKKEIAVGMQALPPEKFHALAGFADMLKQRGFSPRKILIGEDGYAEMFFFAGADRPEWKIIFRTDQDFDRLADNLLSLAHSEKLAAAMNGGGNLESSENSPRPQPLEYIDLRFGNKVYYRER